MGYEGGYPHTSAPDRSGGTSPVLMPANMKSYELFPSEKQKVQKNSQELGSLMKIRSLLILLYYKYFTLILFEEFRGNKLN